MIRRRAEKITTATTTALIQYYLEHDAENVDLQVRREENKIFLSFKGDVYMSEDEFHVLEDYLNQPTVAENEYYYADLIDGSAKQDLRILGSLIDALDLRFDGRTLELNLVKRYPE